MGRASPVAGRLGIRSLQVSREQARIRMAEDGTHAIIEAAAALSCKKTVAWIIRATAAVVPSGGNEIFERQSIAEEALNNGVAQVRV